MHKVFAALVAFALLAPRLAWAADAGPFLVRETGVHEAAINAMAPLVDANGAISGIVTVSDDKTARVWSADGAQSLRELLPPIGAGDDGALYAVATSAKVIAVAGRIRAPQGGYGIAFYSAQDYRFLTLSSGLPSAVLALKMAPSGDRLAVGLAGGGLRVYDLKTKGTALDDPDIPGNITSIDFDPAGRLAVAAGDNLIRLYDAALHRMPPLAMRAGARAYGVAFSHDGTQLAAGDRSRPVVHLFDMRTMKFARDLEGAAGRTGSFNVVAFSPDGGTVFGAGSYIDNASGVLQIRRWPAGGLAATDVPVAHDLVSSLLPTADGLLFATAEPVLGAVDAANHVRVVQSPRHINFHDREHTAVRLSRDGAAIEITQAHGNPLVFDVSARQIVGIANAGHDFPAPATSGYGMSVADWRDGRAPRVNGEKLALEPAETARSAAVSPAGAVLGTDFFVRFIGRNGGWKIPATSPVGAVAASADGRLVVACFDDGTIHWFNAADGRELVALFIDPATGRFVIWTPAGYFDHDHPDADQPGASQTGASQTGASQTGASQTGASQTGASQTGANQTGASQTGASQTGANQTGANQTGPSQTGANRTRGIRVGAEADDGRTLIGYRVNEPSGRASDFVSIGQLYPIWFRPDLVGLSFRDDGNARHKVEQQQAQSGKVEDTLGRGLPPKVTLLDACAVPSVTATTCDGARAIELTRGIAVAPPEVTTPALLLRYQVEEQGNAAGHVVARLNDAVLNVIIQVESRSEHGRIEHTVIPLARGLNEVRLTPVSGSGAIEADSGAAPRIRLVRSIPREQQVTAEAAKPVARLFVLTVGVDHLANAAWDLANPANDATALADLLREDRGHLFAAVNVTALTDANATKANIISGLRDIGARVTPDDVVVIFLAGHGRTVDGHYYFAPSDMGRHDPALLANVSAAHTDAAFDTAVDAVFRTEGLGQDALLPLLQDMPATRIAFMLDTCYSATVADADAVLRHDVNDTITNRIGHASGRFVLSGSFTEAFDSAAGADQAVGTEGHGLFTSYLLKALRGEAGTDDTGRIDIYKLATFTRERVAAASRRILEQNAANAGDKTPDVQQPAYYFAGNDFFAVRKLQSAALAR